ncbi:MAG: 50S ribosomal protein L1 [Pseudomonadota bacterium]
MAKMGKKLRAAYKTIDIAREYDLTDLVDLLKANANAKFDETVEVAMKLNVDTRHADQQVRGVISLPHGSGKSLRVAVFARGDKAEEAQNAGADIVGAEDLMEKIQGGFTDFDRCIATPDMMPIVGRLGKVLGPKGLMPNPKLGTVTTNVVDAVAASKGGDVQYRAEKTGTLHAGVGKVSFGADALVENIVAFVKAIQAARPTGAKGTFIEKVSVSSTMGPGIKLDVATLK